MSNVDTTDSAPVQTKEYKSKKGRRILALVLVVLFILLITVSAFLARVILPQGEIAKGEEAGGLTWVRSIYGWGPSEKEQILGPGSTAVGGDGTIWTNDGASGKVVGFTPDGALKATIGVKGPTPVLTATDVAADADGRVYITESSQDILHVRNAADEELLTVRVKTPMGVAVSDDRIVVGSVAGFAILDKQGKVIKIIGTNGKGENQFDTVNGLAIAKDGTIYVADTYNNRISAYDKQGNRLWIVRTGNPGNKADITGAGKQRTKIKEEAKLQIPLQLALDGNGRIVVVDAFDFSLTVLDPENGKLIAKYGRFGSKDGQFMYPSGIAYDPQRDWFVVADSMNNRLQIVRLPDSGASPLAAAARSLTGPIRACLVPLVLLLIALIAWLTSRARKKKKDQAAAAAMAAETTADNA